jgi:hypothetical protein
MTFLSIEVHFLQELIRMFLYVFPPLQAQITGYVEYFGQCTSEQFPDDIAEVYLLFESVFLVCMVYILNSI